MEALASNRTHNGTSTSFPLDIPFSGLLSSVIVFQSSSSSEYSLPAISWQTATSMIADSAQSDDIRFLNIVYHEVQEGALSEREALSLPLCSQSRTMEFVKVSVLPIFVANLS